MEWIAAQLFSAVERAMKGAEKPLGALEAAFMANIRFVTKHPGAPRMIFSELQRTGGSAAPDIARSLMKRYGERLQEVIEEGKRAGEIREDVSPESAARVFIGVLQGLARATLFMNDSQSLFREAPEAFSIFRRGIEKVGEA